MRRLLIEADPKADAALVERVDRLYAAARGRAGDPADRVARRRAIAAGMERLRAKDPQRYEEILLRLRRYDQRLRRFGFRDRHLDWDVSTAEAVRFGLREVLVAMVLLPLALVALAAFAVPYYVTGYAARWLTRDADVAATAKVLGGFVIYAAWLALLAAGAWWFAGTRTALAPAGRASRRRRRGTLRDRTRVGGHRRHPRMVSASPDEPGHAGAFAPPALRAGRRAGRGECVARRRESGADGEHRDVTGRLASEEFEPQR